VLCSCILVKHGLVAEQLLSDDTLPTQEILKARRRADYQRYKELARAQRAQRKQAKDAARKQEKEKRAAQLQQLLKPATALETKQEDATADQAGAEG